LEPETLKNIDITLSGSDASFFISKNDILNLLRDHRITPNGSITIQKINIDQLEQSLNENPYIGQSQVFIDAMNNLHVAVMPRIPILRVINNDGVGYYIDEHHEKMPLSDKFTARVPVATIDSGISNFSADSISANQLLAMVDFIRSDSLMNAITEQIIVHPNYEFELISNISRATFYIGDTSNLFSKMNNLKLFLKTEWKKNGLLPYSLINLKYKNEIYCTRREDGASNQDKTNSALNRNEIQTN
jgi:cell division protein FtsQ